MNLNRAIAVFAPAAASVASARTRLNLATFLSVAVMSLIANSSAASLVPLSEIIATGDRCQSCPFPSAPRRTVDGNFSSLWHGTNDLEIGDVNILAYQFERLTNIFGVGLFMMNRHEAWELGELEIQVSDDAEDAFSGSWLTIASLPGSTAASILTVNFQPVETSWLRLRMEYQGRGALGFSPAFRLHEVQFHEVEVVESSAEVPAPATGLLIAVGVAIFAWRRRFDNRSQF